jgi:hypothetical protein
MSKLDDWRFRRGAALNQDTKPGSIDLSALSVCPIRF